MPNPEKPVSDSPLNVCVFDHRAKPDPASRGFWLAWLLAFSRSGSRGLSFRRRSVNKPTTQQIRHTNDFVNAKSRARGKPLLAV